jgi:GNAT superfamily N-acetyltransferase
MNEAKDQWRIAHVGDDALDAMNAILQLCGEHMHRVQGMGHWYPYRTGKKYRDGLDMRYLYAIYDGDVLVGTFNLNPKARTYYADVAWADKDAKAIYLGSFGILPAWQGRGLGSWVMAQIEALSASLGYEALRFDGASTNAPLLRWYEQLGYALRDLVMMRDDYGVQCYEKAL